jgi:two-component system sensor histidine kinase KdpD
MIRILPLIEILLSSADYIIWLGGYDSEERTMKIAEHPKQLAQSLIAAVAVLGVTSLLVFLQVSATTAGLAFLTLVVWFATLAGSRLSLLVALAGAASFDFFFLPPFHTLRLAGVQQWVAMVSFAASSAVVSRVAERARQQKLKAEQRRSEVEQLYALGQQMMLYEDAEQLLTHMPRMLAGIFALEAVALYVCENDGYYLSAGESPMGLRASLQAMVAGPVLSQEQAGEFTLRPLLLGLRPVGALAWRPDPFSRDAATAVCAQVAIAVARSMAIEAATRLQATREAERLRVALTDSLTHELRTPLTSIRAAASTLLDGGALDAELRNELTAVIDEEAARLDMLIGEAVEMAELDARPIKVNLERHRVRLLLEQALETSAKNLARHQMVLEEPGNDRSAWFDAHLLSRVLRHLLENAAAHTPPGTVVRLSTAFSGDRLSFIVEDNGPGIDARDLPHIFERFYRGQRKKPGSKGSGMGLAIVRSLLTAHAGGIEAESESGHGARFRFWVPLIEHDPHLPG